MEPWLVFYLVAYAFSSTFSEIPGRTLIECFKQSAIILTFYATFHYCRTDKNQGLVLAQSLSFLAGLLSFIGLIQYLGGLPNHWWHVKGFLSSVYVNHNHFAGFLELAFPITLGLSITEKDLSKKILFIFLGVLIATAFLFTLSRGGYATMLTCLVFFAFLLAVRRHLQSIGWVAPVLLALVVVSATVFGTHPIQQRLETIRQIDTNEMSWNSRLLIWGGAWKIISNHLWLGAGPGTFEFAFLKYHPLGFGTRPVYTHNDYLNLMADCGLLSFVAVLGGFAVLMVKGFLIVRQNDDRRTFGLSAAYLTALLALLVHGLVDFNFHIPANWMWFTIIAGLMLSLNNSKHSNSCASRKTIGIFVTITTLLTLGGSLIFGLSDFYLWKGQRLLEKGAIKKAVLYFNNSIRLNTINDLAFYSRGLANEHLEGGTENAINDFTRAGALNRLEPYYDFHRLKNISRRPYEKPEEIILAYRRGLEKDPNDLKLLSLVLKESMKLSKPDTKFFQTQISEWMANLMRMNDGYVPEDFNNYMSRHILWRGFREFFLKSFNIDPQLKYRLDRRMGWAAQPTVVLKLSDFKRKKSTDEFGVELLHCNDEVTKEITTINRVFRVILNAKGSLAGHSYPFLVLKLDDKVVDAFYIDSPTYTFFYSAVDATPGVHVLSVQYVNDYAGGNPRMNRNVWISQISIQYPETL